MMTRHRALPQVRPSEPVALPEPITRSEYVSLRTFRPDGSAVDCPVWFAWSADGSTIWFRSKRHTAKVRRIVEHPDVELRACGWRGEIDARTPSISGPAVVLEANSAECRRAEDALRTRYGWKWNSVPLFRIPGTNTVETKMSLGEKIRHIRSGATLPDSCLVAIRV